ncbi:hypothetical protein V5O48_009797 [Marasmius crinis-equi]|uniref:GST N-terminal domain-containing protein n=1 Tax=Marasmius crinis-equi TaxID=585013 RepID=A0ABR3FAQ1_9AGAR
MDTSKPVIFYDVLSGPPLRPYAINPWRTRFALNAKQLHYRTEWVDFTEIETVRKRLGVAPVAKNPDGSELYTLPMIHDQANSVLLGDSFEIAVYLDKKYQNSGLSLFPDSASVELARTVHRIIDTHFRQFFGLLAMGMPLPPETVKVATAEFARRAGVEKWEDLWFEGELRVQKLAEFRDACESVAKLYKVNEDGTQGPFFEGRTSPVYADLIVAGWMRTLKSDLREWEDFTMWQGGLWGRVYSETEKFAQAK